MAAHCDNIELSYARIGLLPSLPGLLPALVELIREIIIAIESVTVPVAKFFHFYSASLQIVLG